MTAPTRPVLRYHGGKWRLAPWIIQHMPAHRIYVEPFCGAASVLMRKPRTYSEVINDLDGEIVNVFRVLRDRTLSRDLEMSLRLTPFARSEFEEAYYAPAGDDPVELARRTIARAFMGFGSASVTGKRIVRRKDAWNTPGTGFRANSDRSGTTPAHDWAHFPEQIMLFVERLQGVVIENRDALECIPHHDREDTLIYCDPPYVAVTRDAGGDYRHEMTDEQHQELAELLHKVNGMVILSGYECPLYEQLFDGWRISRKTHHIDGARKRTECLWLNPAAASRLPGRLFEE